MLYAVVNNSTGIVENSILLEDQSTLPPIPEPFAIAEPQAPEDSTEQEFTEYLAAVETYNAAKLAYHDSVVAANLGRYTAPDGYSLILSDAVIGSTYASGVFSAPIPPTPPELSSEDQIKLQITNLEFTISPRRIREAVLGTDNDWLKNVNDQITALRAQL